LQTISRILVHANWGPHERDRLPLTEDGAERLYAGRDLDPPQRSLHGATFLAGTRARCEAGNGDPGPADPEGDPPPRRRMLAKVAAVSTKK
jgi:hypothetical protein